MAMESEDIYKLLILGDSGVGKSTLALQYTEEKFYESFSSTIGIDFFIKYINLECRKIKLQIWDSAGQERYRAVCAKHYRGSHGILLVYDTTSRKSFQNLQQWVELIKESELMHLPKILVGNKSDMADRRAVQSSEGRKYADSLINSSFFECSAKDFEAVNEVFQSLTHSIYQIKAQEENDSGDNDSNDDNKNKSDDVKGDSDNNSNNANKDKLKRRMMDCCRVM